MEKVTFLKYQAKICKRNFLTPHTFLCGPKFSRLNIFFSLNADAASERVWEECQKSKITTSKTNQASDKSVHLRNPAAARAVTGRAGPDVWWRFSTCKGDALKSLIKKNLKVPQHCIQKVSWFHVASLTKSIREIALHPFQFGELPKPQNERIKRCSCASTKDPRAMCFIRSYLNHPGSYFPNLTSSRVDNPAAVL